MSITEKLYLFTIMFERWVVYSLKSIKIMLLGIYFLVLAGICTMFMADSVLGTVGAVAGFLISPYLIIKGLIKKDWDKNLIIRSLCFVQTPFFLFLMLCRNSWQKQALLYNILVIRLKRYKNRYKQALGRNP